jgi:hypothetical protein
MNTESVQVLKKRINEVDATCRGDIDANMALCRLLGLVTGYVPGNMTIVEKDQQYLLNRVLEILNSSKK